MSAGWNCAVGDEAGDAAALLADLGDLAVEADGDAEFVHQPLEAEGDVVEAAVHVPEVVAELDRRQAVHERRRVIGRRADVLDEVVEHVLHVARLEKPLHAAVHRAEQVELRETSTARRSARTPWRCRGPARSSRRSRGRRGRRSTSGTAARWRGLRRPCGPPRPSGPARDTGPPPCRPRRSCASAAAAGGSGCNRSSSCPTARTAARRCAAA